MEKEAKQATKGGKASPIGNKFAKKKPSGTPKPSGGGAGSLTKPYFVHHRKKPSNKLAMYLLDANKQYVVGCTKAKFKKYDDLILDCKRALENGEISTKAAAVAFVTNAIQANT